LRVKPLFRWPGGKSRHLKYILPLIPAHHCYCEPFAGGLAVFLAKERSQLEVINDQNGMLVALYRNAKYHVEELVAEVQWILNARRGMEDFREQQGLTEIQRVARWLVRNRLSYGGLGRNFGMEGARSSRENTLRNLRELNERLDRTVIEQMPYENCIAHYDKPNTFFFLDPPYLNARPGVYDGWTEGQMRALADVIGRIKGSWIITVDDSAATRRIFQGYRLRKLRFDNKLAAMRSHQVVMRELVITRRQGSTPARSP
jgi:DNA adenine methylase